MSGWISDSANDAFDALIFNGNNDLRTQTKAIVDSVDEIGDYQINQWRDEILPQIQDRAHGSFLNSRRGPVSINDWNSQRVIGCMLRRFKSDNDNYAPSTGTVAALAVD